MIPQSTDHIKALHERAINESRELDPDTKQAIWATIFQAADKVAKSINRSNPLRDLEAIDVVNQWYIDLENTAGMTHDYRAHDRVTGFLTISQELKDAEETENREAYALWEKCFREWYFGGKQGPKPKMPKKVHYCIVSYEDHETFGTGAWSEQEDDVEALEAERERNLGFFQDPNEDPENPMEDALGCKRLTVRHTAHGDRFMYRGSPGVLNGVYNNTLPEPNYRTPKGRANLLKSLLKSDNVLDIELAKGMNRKFRFSAEAKAKANATKLQTTK